MRKLKLSWCCLNKTETETKVVCFSCFKMSYTEEEQIAMQNRSLTMAREICFKEYGAEALFHNGSTTFNETIKKWMCPPYFDTIYCWPPTPADTVSAVPCPSYIYGFIETSYATKQCMSDGSWYVNEKNRIWTNYTECIMGETVTAIYPFKVNKTELENLEDLVMTLTIISLSGYALSFASLIVAFCIMFFIKKLHCARNILHMNLFASFILRAFIYILKSILFVRGVGLSKDFVTINGKIFFDTTTHNYECKLMISLANYFTTANYFWLLMEGIHLSHLIFRPLHAHSRMTLKPYIILGWGLPVLVVIPWVAARIFFEDVLCWTLSENYWIFLIIDIPITISILINSVLFIGISKVLYTKIRSTVNGDFLRYWKWAKFTLSLVPLFGVHCAFYNIVQFTGEGDSWLIFDMFFSSYQGFFVAVLYCFWNSEVKEELKPYVYSTLTFLAKNRIFRYCFPCRQKFLRQKLDAVNKNLEKPKYDNTQDSVCSNSLMGNLESCNKSSFSKCSPSIINNNNRNVEMSLCIEKTMDKGVVDHSHDMKN